MPIRLDINDKDFHQRMEQLVHHRRDTHHEVEQDVRRIIDDVKAHGDDAVIKYTQQWDDKHMTIETMRISQQACRTALESISTEQRHALDHAIQRIRTYHEAQTPQDYETTDAHGIVLGMRWRPIERVGLYIPGGTAAYPSSLLMNAIPAQVAGVKNVISVVPCPQGQTNPLVLAAASLLDITDIYRVGGAQAIAALAYGTQTIPKTDKIVGPGNQYVAEAKRRVFGVVGIDMIAGPSEVVIVADKTAHAPWVAIDLLAQAEHDENAQSIVITDDKTLCQQVEHAVEEQLRTLPRAGIAKKSWEKHGALILVNNLASDAPTLIDQLAGEHLQLEMDNPASFMQKIRYAGSIFLGHHTPEAIGDYIGGPNHVLPTSRSARFSSGLSVYDFLVRNSYMACNAQTIHALGKDAVTLAEAEGLDAHARSVNMRLNNAPTHKSQQEV